MSAELHLVLEDLRPGRDAAAARDASDLARALIDTAPKNCVVEGLVGSWTTEQRRDLQARMPGLAEVQSVALPRPAGAKSGKRAHGVAEGMVHAPGLVAPLRKHDRAYDPAQFAVTITDLRPWLRPQDVGQASAAWHRWWLKRVRRFADAVVVPTHAIAAELAGVVDLGDRVRVIGTAPSPSVALPLDAEWRARKLGLPDRYVLTTGTLAAGDGLRDLVAAWSTRGDDLPLVVLGADEHGSERTSVFAAEQGMPEGRVVVLGAPGDADLAVAFDRASAFLHPATFAGSAQSILHAFAFGTPVVHLDTPALGETAGGAGVSVVRTSADGENGRRLVGALDELLASDGDRANRAVSGADRVRAFSWDHVGEQVWQLHADL